MNPQQQPQQIQIPPFTLFAIVGCPHCSEAEIFLRARNIPAWVVIANGDSIIQAGIKQATNQDQYPVLLHKATNEIVVGFDKEKYERIAQNYFALLESGSTSLLGNVQQPVAETSVQAASPQPA